MTLVRGFDWTWQGGGHRFAGMYHVSTERFLGQWNGQDGAPRRDLSSELANGNSDGSGIYQGFYDFDLAVSHNDPNTAWVGVTALSATYDGGATWQRIGAYSASTYDIGWIHPDIQGLSVMGEHLVGDRWRTELQLRRHCRPTNPGTGIYNSTFWGLVTDGTTTFKWRTIPQWQYRFCPHGQDITCGWAVRNRRRRA